MMMASHSTVFPAGDFATQCERSPEFSVTETRWLANRGRFSKRRQKWNNSPGVLLIVTALTTFLPRLPVTAARDFDFSRTVGMESSLLVAWQLLFYNIRL